jgi:hypothetical protein
MLMKNQFGIYANKKVDWHVGAVDLWWQVACEVEVRHLTLKLAILQSELKREKYPIPADFIDWYDGVGSFRSWTRRPTLRSYHLPK